MLLTKIYLDTKFLRFEHDFPCGLVVRIPGFHPGGPGSIPGMGMTIIFPLVSTTWLIHFFSPGFRFCNPDYFA